jgi:DNA-binding LytR/AlgR family response regulator
MNIRPCALIVEDEPFVALDLEDAMVDIEAARWLREACGAEVVFITGHTDRATLELIHEQVPGAPVLPKPVSHARLAEVVAALV